MDPLLNDMQTYRGLFLARITAVNTPTTGPLTGRPVYDWVEQIFDPDTGADTDADPARKGIFVSDTEFDNCMIDPNDSVYSPNEFVWIRMKGAVAGTTVYEAVAKGGSPRCQTACPVWYTAYHHLAAPAVTVGDKLAPGALVGAVGKFTGMSAHLHFSLGDGSAFLVVSPEIVVGQTLDVEDWFGYEIAGTRNPGAAGPLYYPPVFEGAENVDPTSTIRCTFAPPLDPDAATWLLYHGSAHHQEGEYYANDIYPEGADPTDPDDATMLGALVYLAVSTAEVESEVIYADEISPSAGYMVIVKHTRKACGSVTFTPGCGLKEDPLNPGTYMVDAEAVAGDGLVYDELTTCTIKVFPGCGVYIDGLGRVAIDGAELINTDAPTGTRPIQSGLGWYTPPDDSCPYFYVNSGCGLIVRSSDNKLMVDAESIAGDGLVSDDLTDCKIKVYPGCGIYIMETGQVAVALEELINTEVTEGRPILSGLEVYTPSVGETCPFIYIKTGVGCGLTITSNNELVIDWDSLVYPDGGLEVVDDDVTPEHCNKKLRIDPDYLKNYLTGTSWLERIPVMCADISMAVGACAGILDQNVIITYDEDVEGWVSDPLAVVTDTGSWTLYFFAPDIDHPVPWAFLLSADEMTTVDLEWITFADGKAWFAGTGSELCGGEPDMEDCPKNSFRVAIGCCYADPCFGLDPPEVVAMVDDATADVDQLLHFTATGAGGTGDYFYAWDFGDGIGTSLIQNPDYAYAAPGTYTAIVTISDGCNFTTDEVEIVVGETVNIAGCPAQSIKKTLYATFTGDLAVLGTLVIEYTDNMAIVGVEQWVAGQREPGDPIIGIDLGCDLAGSLRFVDGGDCKFWLRLYGSGENAWNFGESGTPIAPTSFIPFLWETDLTSAAAGCLTGTSHVVISDTPP